MLTCEQICKRVVRATSSHRLNYMTIGIPALWVPQEAVETGIFLLPPNDERDVTFKITTGDDFYVDRITCQLYVVAGQVGARTLTPVPTGRNGIGAPGAVPCDVRVRLHAADARRDAGDQQQDWTSLAGTARFTSPVQPAFVMNSSRVYTLQVRNYEQLTTFAMAFVLHGRRRRAQDPKRGWSTSDEQMLQRLFGDAHAAGELNYGQPLTQDYQTNLSTVGAYKTLQFPGQNPAVAGAFDVNFPIVLPAGTFDAPVRLVTNLLADRRYAFMARQLMVRQIEDQSTTGLAIEGATEPEFVRLYDQNAQYWITNGPVPVGALFGDGGRPYRLMPTWAWGRNANIMLEIANYSVLDLQTALAVEGWFRDTRVC